MAGRLLEEGGRALVVAIVAGLAVLAVAGVGFVGVCTQTSVDCHLRPSPHLDLSRTTGQIALPEGFSTRVVAPDLHAPTDFDFLPDGGILVAERVGLVRLFRDGKAAGKPVLDIRPRVSLHGFRGLMAVAVDPEFAENRYVYVAYSSRAPGATRESTRPAEFVVSRFSIDADGRATDERRLIGTAGADVAGCKGLPVTADCQRIEGDHVGSDIVFGDDGTLFVTTGDGGGEERVEQVAFGALDIDSLAGKILHVTRQGLGLSSNPFFDGDVQANRSKVWGYGLRNPFRIALTPDTGIPVVGEVGWTGADSIIVVPRGANMGWPCWEGAAKTREYESTNQCEELYESDDEITEPAVVIEHTGFSTSVTGGVFVSSDVYPPDDGTYFYGDWAKSTLERVPLDPATGEAQGDPVVFAETAGGPVSLGVGPDGQLYYLALNYGALYRIDYRG